MFPSNKVETQLHDMSNVVVGFFVGNIMKKQKNKKDENITVDLIAEQWARLLLAQIRANNNTTLIKGKDTFRSPFSHK